MKQLENQWIKMKLGIKNKSDCINLTKFTFLRFASRQIMSMELYSQSHTYQSFENKSVRNF